MELHRSDRALACAPAPLSMPSVDSLDRPPGSRLRKTSPIDQISTLLSPRSDPQSCCRSIFSTPSGLSGEAHFPAQPTCCGCRFAFGPDACRPTASRSFAAAPNALHI